MSQRQAEIKEENCNPSSQKLLLSLGPKPQLRHEKLVVILETKIVFVGCNAEEKLPIFMTCMIISSII